MKRRTELEFSVLHYDDESINFVVVPECISKYDTDNKKNVIWTKTSNPAFAHGLKLSKPQLV